MVMRKLQAGGTRTHSLPRQTVLTPSCISSLRTHLEGTWSQPSISSANLTSRRLRCTLATPSTTQRSVSRLWSDPRVVSGHGTERGFEPCLSRPRRVAICGSHHADPRAQDDGARVCFGQGGRHGSQVGGRLATRGAEIRSHHPEARLRDKVHRLQDPEHRRQRESLRFAFGPPSCEF